MPPRANCRVFKRTTALALSRTASADPLAALLVRVPLISMAGSGAAVQTQSGSRSLNPAWSMHGSVKPTSSPELTRVRKLGEELADAP